MGKVSKVNVPEAEADGSGVWYPELVIVHALHCISLHLTLDIRCSGTHTNGPYHKRAR